MSSFLKIAIRNLLKGPSTDPYPFGETFVPKGLRGKIKYNAKACVACRMCEHVCAGGAIQIREVADKSGLEFILWHNTCAFCGLCEHYCPTKAIRLTEDYHTAHKQEDKYRYVEKGFIKYVNCAQCGTPMVPIASELLNVAYDQVNKDIEKLRHLCPKCRQERALR
ncbi:4Fe-4S dicluster domain-containing protein [Thermanaerosceptrum fracticalcis]|uniref:4Fe-4S dicluster domain-containing protein n=1 Tax=Thermanaerosceptrum fracticalcis TaxID=1712410 RepID=A0A7G6E1Q8_THEFR|nr:4Fe-4S dicluster domain-containing protein [Thermanaerosceptrum fracticalcis]QNB46012.1 4Fe-4S dicluster domain-containing protein [Thermanaerosceptrum fracticalcis]